MFFTKLSTVDRTDDVGWMSATTVPGQVFLVEWGGPSEVCMIKPRLPVFDRFSISHRTAYAGIQCSRERRKKSDISLLLVVNRRDSVGRLRRVGGEEGLTADGFFSGVLCSGYRELVKTKW